MGALSRKRRAAPSFLAPSGGLTRSGRYGGRFLRAEAGVIGPHIGIEVHAAVVFELLLFRQGCGALRAECRQFALGQRMRAQRLRMLAAQLQEIAVERLSR